MFRRGRRGDICLGRRRNNTHRGEFKVTRGRGEEEEAMLWDGELTGDKSGKPGDKDECGLPGELSSHVRSIVSVTTGAGHTTGTKWLGNQLFAGGQDATTLRPSACRCTLLHAG